MNDKIRYIHIGLQGGLGMPIAYSFVGSEGAEGSAREDGKRDTAGVQREEAGCSLELGRGSLNKNSGKQFKSWLLKMFEIGFAHPL